MNPIDQAKDYFYKKRRLLKNKWNEPEEIMVNGVKKIVSYLLFLCYFGILLLKHFFTFFLES
jgi:hypothetical protein